MELLVKFATIGKAAEILQPGDTCIVREGKYRETCRPVHSGKEGLSPQTTYTLSAWLKVDNPAEPVVLGVKNHGSEEISIACHSTRWERKSIRFTTGKHETVALVYLLKPGDGTGVVWCDNLILPLHPAVK